MAWTSEQQQAIDTENKHLLVAAAAGSGKTAVLVNRIVRKVLDGAADVDEILAITFTHAAADEMRGRIEKAILDKLETETDEKTIALLERQRILLPGAYISTLHSFCQRIISQNFSVLGLDPEFRTAGEEELKLLKQDALDELFNEEYEEGREDFLQFTDSFGGDARGDGKLYNLILNLYEYSRSEGDSKNWLTSLVDALDLPEETDLTDTPWYEVIAKDIRLQMEDALFTANRTLEAMEEYGVPVYENTVKEDISILERLSAVTDANDFSAIADAFLAADFQRLPALKKSDAAANEEAKIFIKESRDCYKGIVKGIAENYFQIDEAEYIRTLKIAASDMGELVNLVNKFEEKYSALKRQKNILDFSDMEHFALDLLTEKSNGEAKPSAVAVALGTKFKEIMVDEYQDTNGAQEAIISLIIAGGNAKLFCVGDVKQSIYRFRLADPSLFLKKYAEYRHLGDNYDRIDLAKNFRSRGEIISGINYIFAQVMNEDTMELNYGEEEALYLGADYPQAENTLKSPIELAIFVDPTEKEFEAREDEEEKIAVFEEESRYVAKRIRELINESRMVFDKDKKSYRPISYRDIVILLRSVRGKAEVMQEVLQEYDIPVYANLDGGYFEESEVRLMLALLTTLQNARQDIPLAAVLASPIGGFSFEEIGLLRAQKDDDDFFSALIFSVSEGSALDDELKSKVSIFLAKLSKWRTLARELSVPELISTLYLETGFYDYVGGLPNGLVRKENLRLLIDRAAAYEETDYRGLSRFLRFVDKIRKNSADLSSAKTIGEGEDVVRIMSVHKSKGLEFPVVFMSDLGKKFNEQDTTADLLIHSKLGLGPYFTDVDASYRYPTFPRVAIRSKILSENRAEELRALYVGMTRAREKLIMTGSVKGEEAFQKKMRRYAMHIGKTSVKLPSFQASSARSFLDWLLMSLIRHPDGENLRDAAGCFSAPAPLLDYDDDSSWSVEILAPSTAPDNLKPAISDDMLIKVKNHELLPATKYKDEIEDILGWRYDDGELFNVKGKISVTELKNLFAEAEEDTISIFPSDETLNRPNFLMEKSPLTGAEYGTLMHSVMEHIDPQKATSVIGVNEEISRLIALNVLKEEDSSRINAALIAKFFNSPIGERLKNSRKVYKELAFSRLIDASLVYPEAADEKIITQGVIDLLFEDEHGLVLIDYKTDRPTKENTLRERYAGQISLYKAAVLDILGKSVNESYLYLLSMGKLLAV